MHELETIGKTFTLKQLVSFAVLVFKRVKPTDEKKQQQQKTTTKSFCL